MRLSAEVRFFNEHIVSVLDQRWERIAPALILLLGFLVRILRIEANGLRTDEVYSLWMASRTLPDLLGTVLIQGRDATPPAYNVMLHFVRLLSRDVWAARMITVLAGTGVVWATYELARRLFDFRIAATSAMLMAMSPFSVEYSQVARAYALSGLLAFLSIYFFISNWHMSAGRWARRMYFITTLAAIGTHYVTAVVVIAQNLYVAILFLLHRVARPELRRWVLVQALLALLCLPLAWIALPKLPMSAAGTGQTWLAAPSIQGIARTLILWGTGDPSYGPSRFTLERLASLVVLLSLLVPGGLTAWRRWNIGLFHREEVRRIVSVAFSFFVPLLLLLGISLFRRVFNDKYFLFLIPLFLILLAWSAFRMRPSALGSGLFMALIGLTSLSLVIYHTAPAGEQWREAVAYIEEDRQATDPVAAVPGYYMRPLAYYLTDALPPHDDDFSSAEVAILTAEGFLTTDGIPGSASLARVQQALDSAETLWLVTGYTPVQPERLSWFWKDYKETDHKEFLGVQVIQGERK